MADVKQFFTHNANGIYEGKLVENMAITVKRTGQQVINVLIPELWEEGQPYPYTYVGMWHNLPDLLKDDKVWVKFADNNYLYPMLYRYKGVPEKLYVNPEMPQAGQIVSFPSLGSEDDDEKIEGSYAIGRTGFVLETVKHVIIKYEKEYMIYEKDKGIWINCTGEFNVKANNTELKMEKNKSRLWTYKWEFNMEELIKLGKAHTLGNLIRRFLILCINLCSILEQHKDIHGHLIDGGDAGAIAGIRGGLTGVKSDWDTVFE